MSWFNWRRWLHSLTRPVATIRNSKNRPPRLNPRLEELEDRTAPATFRWTGAAATDNWTVGSNWQGGIAPTGLASKNEELLFDALAPASERNPVNNITNGVFRSITISAAGYNLTGNQLTLGNTTTVSTGFITAGAGASGTVIDMDIKLAGPATGSTSITVNSSASLIISGDISNGPNAPTLVKIGSGNTGMLTLSGNNNGYTGQITVQGSAGVLAVTHNNALGAGSQTVIGSGSQLQVSNNITLNESLLIDGTGVSNTGAILNTGGDNVISGTVALNSDVTLGAASGTSLRYSGAISDLGASAGFNLTKEGQGQIIFSTANTYRGLTTINDGVLTVRHRDALGLGGTTASGTIVQQNASPARFGRLDLENNITVETEFLTLNNTGFGGLGALYNASGDNTWDGPVFLGSTGTISSQVNIGVADSTVLTIRGVVQGQPGKGGTVLPWHKINTGTLVFTNANTYASDTFVDAGILNIRDSKALGTTAGITTVASGASLELQVDDLLGDVVGGNDSVTGDQNSLRISEDVNVTGAGATNSLAVLYSISGINEWKGDINMSGASATIGVDPDSSPNADASYFTNDWSLTVTGDITGGTGTTLQKVLSGHLILLKSNPYLGPTHVQQGWITVAHNDALGARVPNVGDTLQPKVTIDGTAAVHLLAITENGATAATTVPDLNLHQRFEVTGRGLFDHPYAKINQKGAILNLSGVNVISGNIKLLGLVGFGVQPLAGVVGGGIGGTLANGFPQATTTTAAPGLGSELTLLGQQSEGQNVINVPATPAGGTSAQQATVIDTGAAAGTLNIFVDVYSARDNLRVYYGDFLNDPLNAVLIYDSTTSAPLGSGLPDYPNLTNEYAADVTITYDATTATATAVSAKSTKGGFGKGKGGGSNFGKGYSAMSPLVPLVTNYALAGNTEITIVMNQGGNTASGFTQWEYNAKVSPNSIGGGGIEKLGDNRLIIQGNGFFTGLVDVVEGVLRAQNDTALGAPGTGTVVRSGAALELIGSLPKDNGGINTNATVTGGLNGLLDVWGEHLTLNGTGNTTFGVKPLEFVNTAAAQTLTTTPILNNDIAWRGDISLNTDTTLDIPLNSRFRVFGAIDDDIDDNPLTTTGVTITKSGLGELYLAGNNIFNGQMKVDAGILSIENSLALGAPSTATTGDTVVADGATLQIYGSLSIVGETLTLQGKGVAAANLPNTATVPLRWYNIGPSALVNSPAQITPVPLNQSLTGRVTSVAIDPSDGNVIYIATADGGAWKTKNGGVTWQPLFEVGGPSVAGGSIAISPNDRQVIYFATGEANTTDSLYGSGVYMSVNMGQSWVLLTDGGTNPLDRKAISKVVVGSNVGSDVVFVSTSDIAATGTTTGGVGVWRYTSGGGGTWINIATGGPGDDPAITFPTTNATWSDLQLLGNTLYAALGSVPGTAGPPDNRRDNAVYRATNIFGPGPAIWAVDDGGPGANAAVQDDWMHHNNTIYNFTTLVATGVSFGNIKLAATTTGTIDVYASISTPGGTLAGLRKSINGGATWATLTIPDYMGGQGNYNNAIVANGATVYVAGATIYQSTDAGVNWTDISNPAGGGPHSSFHSLSLDSSNRLVAVSDGGVWRWDGTTWTNLTANLGVTQFNGIASHPTDVSQAIGGTWANGTASWNADSVSSTSPIWDVVDTGQGGQVEYSPSNPNIVFWMQGNTLRRSTYNPTTGVWTSSSLGTLTSNRGAFSIDPVNSQRVLAIVSGLGVVESLDGGLTFPTNLGGGGTMIAAAAYQGTFVNDAGGTGFPGVGDRLPDHNEIETIWTASATSINLTKDYGATWRTRNLGGGNDTFISSLIVDPRNRDTAYVTRSTFTATGSNRIFKTTDAGQNWIDITGPTTGPGALPNMAVWTIALDPRNENLYIGTDQGVWTLSNGGTNWTQLAYGMPNVQVKTLDLSTTLNTLTAGTYGRGAYQYFLSDLAADSGVLRSMSGDATWAGEIKLAGNTTVSANGTQDLQIGASRASLTISGVISDVTPGPGNWTLTKIGFGDVIFSGTNTYGGQTRVEQGVLVVDNVSALGGATNGTIVLEGNQLQMRNSIDLEPLTLHGNGFQVDGHWTGALRSVSNTNTYSGPITLMTSAAPIAPFPGSPAVQAVTVGVDIGSQLTITGVIDDLGVNVALIKELTGKLILAAPNTYGGHTYVNQRELEITHQQALGDSGTTANGTTVLDNAQLRINNTTATPFTISEYLNLTGDGIGLTNQGALVNVAGNNTITGNVSLNQDARFAPVSVPPNFASINVVQATNTLFMTGIVSELVAAPDMGLTKRGLGTLDLSGDNSYRGVTDILQGTLVAAHNKALGTAGGPTGNGTQVTSGATLALRNNITVTGETATIIGIGVGGVGAFYNSADNNTWVGPVILATNATGSTTTRMGAAANTEGTITGVIQDPSPAPTTPASLFKVGAGTITFAGTPDNTYQGSTTVSTGFLKIKDNGSLGGTTNGTTVTTGAALQIDGSTFTVTNEALTLAGAGPTNRGALENISGNHTWDGPVTLSANTTIGAWGATTDTLTMAQTIAQSGGTRTVTKVGPSILQYTAHNTYTGATTVNDGALHLNYTGVTPANAIMGNLVVGDDDATVAALAKWFASNQVPDTATVTVMRDGTADLNGLDDIIDRLIINGGLFTTNATGATGGNLTLTSTSTTNHGLSMAGGTLTSKGNVNLNGHASATSTATATAKIDGVGTVTLPAGSHTFTVDGPQTTDLLLEALLNGSGGLTKTGNGRMEIENDHTPTWTGLATVSAGDLQVDGQVGNVALTGGTLSGIGTVGTITGSSPAVGTVAPGNNGATDPIGVLSSSDATFGPLTTFFVNLQRDPLNNPISDLLYTDGDVTLGGAVLAGTANINIQLGDQFTIVQTVNSGMVIGKFAEPYLGSGDIAFIEGRKFTVAYLDSDADTLIDQVVLTRVQNTASVVVSASTAPATSSFYGQVVSFLATITPEQGALLSTTPSAYLVAFKLDSGPTVTRALVVNATGTSGVATFDPQNGVLGPFLSVGLHTIDATFNPSTGPSPNPDYNEVLATQYTHTINPNTSVMTLSSNLDPAQYGQPVRIKVHIAALAPGVNATPTGTVQFTLYNSVGALLDTPAPAMLDVLGDAYYDLPNPLALGTYQINATYSGNTVFSAITTPGTIFETVNKANVEIAVSGAPLAGTYGSPMSWTALVTPNNTVMEPDSTAVVNAGILKFYKTSAISANFLGVGTMTSPGTWTYTDATGTQLIAGTYTIVADYEGSTNFLPGQGSRTGYLVTGSATTTAVTSTSPNPSSLGQSVLFAATVTSSSGAVPIGTVNFYNNALTNPALNATPITVSITGTANFSTSSLPVGTNNIIAAFTPSNTSFSSSDSALSPYAQQVVVDATATTVSSLSPNPSQQGQSVLVTATVTSGTGNRPTGTVNFYDGLTSNPPLNATPITVTGAATGPGTASFSTSSLTLGLHNIIAAFTPSNLSFTASDSALSPYQQRVQVGTTTALNAAATSNYGDGVLLTATVATAPTSGVPAPVTTGTVNFFDGASVTPLNATAIAVNGSGVATYTTTVGQLTGGAHVLRAEYTDTLASSTYNNSSGTRAHTVNAAPTSTTITSITPGTPTPFGTALTINITVTSGSPAGNPTTGTVAVKVGSTPLGNATYLSGTTWQYITTGTDIAVGNSQTITATYTNTSNYATSNDTELHSVTQSTTSTSVDFRLVGGASVTTAPYGAAALEATVTNMTVPGSTPVGTVEFYKNGVITAANLLGTATLDGTGKATLNPPLIVGFYDNVIARFVATASLATSNSFAVQSNFDVTVTAASAVITLFTSTATGMPANTSVSGQSVTLSATVANTGSPLAPGTANPAGSVDFHDVTGGGSIFLGTGTLSGGVATIGTSALTNVGTRTLRATYTGPSSNYTTGDTETLSQEVIGNPVVITVVPASAAAGAGFNVTAEYRTPGGTVDGTFNGSVTLAIQTAPSGSTLGGTITINFVNGVGTWTGVSLSKAGNHTLVARITGLPDSTASGTIAVTASGFAGSTSPSAPGIGTLFNLLLRAVDSTGATAANFNGTVTGVTVTKVSGPVLGILTSPVVTNVTFVNGVGTLYGLKVSKPAGSSLPYRIRINIPGFAPFEITFITAGRFFG